MWKAVVAWTAVMAMLPACIHAQAGGGAGNDQGYPRDMGANGSQFLRYGDPGLSSSAGAAPLTDTDRVLNQNAYMNDSGTGGYDAGLRSNGGAGTRVASGRAHRKAEARKAQARKPVTAAESTGSAGASGSQGTANRTLPSTSLGSLPLVLGGLSLSGLGVALLRLRAGRKRDTAH